MPFLAVSYGFGDLAEMRKYPCVGVAETADEVRGILSEGRSGDGETVNEVLRRADKAMYEDKEAYRRRTGHVR